MGSFENPQDFTLLAADERAPNLEKDLRSILVQPFDDLGIGQIPSRRLGEDGLHGGPVVERDKALERLPGDLRSGITIEAFCAAAPSLYSPIQCHAEDGILHNIQHGNEQRTIRWATQYRTSSVLQNGGGVRSGRKSFPQARGLG